MSRHCIISKIVDNIGEEVGVGRTSAHFVEGRPNTILLPIGGLNGDNQKLSTKDNTYNWAKTLKSKIDKKFIASKYGSLIQIDTSSPKGTLLHIIMQTSLVNAYIARNNSLNNAAQITSTEKSPSEKVDSVLSEFATKNNIKVEFIDELKDKFGGNILGLYNALDGIIKVAKNERREDTLAEEIVHSITSGLGGRNNTLVDALYTGVSKLDYKSMVPEYIELYAGNEEMLIKEAADKMITKQVLNGINNPFKNLISRIVNKFLSLFKGTEIGQLAELKLLADELATPIINMEKLDLVVSDLPSDKVFYQVADKSKKDKQVSKTLEQELFFRRRLITLKKSIESSKDKDKIKKLNEEYTFIESKLLDLEETKNTQLLVDIGSNLLDSAQKYIEGLESGAKKNTKDDDFIYTIETLGVLDKLKGVSDRSKDLQARFQPFVESKIVEEVNSYWTGGEVTLEDIKGQTEDINRPRKWFGALSDVNNYLASTIGSIITATHNKISTFNKELSNKVKIEVNLLKKWADKSSIAHKNLYAPFIQKMYGTTVLTRQYTSEFYTEMRRNYKDKNSDDLDTSSKAKNWLSSNVWRSEDGNYHATKKEFLNSNYEKIMNTPELKRFYDFYQKTIQESADKLPIKLHGDFIPNIRDKSFIDVFKSDKTISGKLKEGINDLIGLKIHEFRDTDFVGNEELFSDVIPLQYLNKVKAEEKSGDLGESLFKFASFANSHDIMSEVLPKTRLLQEQIKNQRFTKSSNPNVSILGLESNINEMVDKTIAIQLKGQTKKDELKIPLGKVYDENGKEVGNKYIHTSRIIDFGLKYNSLLRIGLNPFNAIANVLFGDISNIIEGSGGRHYTLANLHEATEIFFTQNFNKDSKMNKILEKINPFEINEDYGLTKGLSIKTNLTREKIKDAAYFPQKAGEIFIQKRVATAILLKNGLWAKFDENGNLKKEFEGKVDFDKVAAYINNVITKNHGRYSEKEAAIMQQNVLYRMAIQFKKWIPAAIESRLAGKQFNNKLGVETEGRYITAYKLIFKDLKNTLTRLQNGELSELEIYNMKKNLTELVIALASILMYIGLGWNDDDKRKRSPYYKFCMDQLNRVSGDLLFFYDPTNLTHSLKTPIPLIKTTEDLLSTMKALPYAFYGAIPGYEKDKFKSGPNKGKNKFYSKLQGVTPGIKPFRDVINLYNEEKFVDYSSIP